MGGARIIAVVLLLGCVTTRRHADTYVAKGYRFVGPRVLVVDAYENDLELLQRAFAFHGFKLYPARERVHDYTLRVTGVCYGVAGGLYIKSTMDEYSGGNAPDYLLAEIRDKRGSRVFVARLDDESDCPNAFYEELAEAVDRNWEPDQLNPQTSP